MGMMITVQDHLGTWLLIPTTSILMIESAGEESLIHLKRKRAECIRVKKPLADIEEDLIQTERRCRERPLQNLGVADASDSVRADRPRGKPEQQTDQGDRPPPRRISGRKALD